MADVMNVYELFNAVSGLQIHGDNEADFLAQVRIQLFVLISDVIVPAL